MAKRIIILKRADKKIKKVYSYLVKHWSEKVAEELYQKFNETATLISRYPRIGQPSCKNINVRRKLITKHNCIIIESKAILLLLSICLIQEEIQKGIFMNNVEKITAIELLSAARL